MPELARALLTDLWQEYQEVDERVREADLQLKAWARKTETCRRLSEVPGLGPVGSALLVMKTPDPQGFDSGRDFAAWIGLTPKDHSTAGRQRLGGSRGRATSSCAACWWRVRWRCYGISSRAVTG